MAAILALSRALGGVVSEEHGPRIGVERPGQAPDWNEVLVVATELLVGPALWCAVSDSPKRIPAAVGEQLRQRYLLNIVRNVRFGRALASEDAGYITAQEIAIDGGLGLNPVSLGSVK